MKNDRTELRRVFGLFDLTLLLVVAVVNVNLVPTVAGGGTHAMSLWGLTLVLFFLPLALAVVKLSNQFPQEGGIYIWSKIAFGEFHGFLSGWCYWTNNLFYVPLVLVNLINFSLFMSGQPELTKNVILTAGMSIPILWLMVILTVRSVDFAKWVQNLGSVCTFVSVAVLLGIAIYVKGLTGPMNLISPSSLLPTGEWDTLSKFGVVCFSLVGLELASVMGDEIKNPRSHIPKAILLAGPACILLYGLATLALQASLPIATIQPDSGLLQAIATVPVNYRVWATVPFLISVAGITMAWFSGSARLPFVIGIDRYLPRSFGRTHPVYKTPYIAIIAQGVASSVIILFDSLGTTTHRFYTLLMSTSLVIQMIPFLYLFGAFIKFGGATGGVKKSFFDSRWLCRCAGFLGFVTTAVAIVLTLVPPRDEESVFLYEFKLIFGASVFLIPTIFLYRRKNRNTVLLEN